MNIGQEEPEKSAHAAEQIRLLSNLGYRVEGGILGLVGIFALLETLDLVTGRGVYIWPGLLVLAGILLPLRLFSHVHEDAHSRRYLLADPQQWQHLVIAAGLFLSGIAEIVALCAELWPLRFAWPLALAAIGAMFRRHAQHGTSQAVDQTLRFHRRLGGTLILTALARSIAVLSGIYKGTVGLGWVVLILFAAALLLVFQEHAGAYEAGELSRDLANWLCDNPPHNFHNLSHVVSPSAVGSKISFGYLRVLNGLQIQRILAYTPDKQLHTHLVGDTEMLISISLI